ncbi:Aste57867_11460 [Aphanomyces stellatus]|uniref:Aste57867_11460 protein n=1 Tax=Aphanomyces stellatus TaxID=120398 RepID=A0A485KTG1_9STRA|nr:hypothetical protein As57867_011417 [Aphanomyces stellatus]VFT88321.1 Aste57867_11460 [Aphanomyces stellatus]
MDARHLVAGLGFVFLAKRLFCVGVVSSRRVFRLLLQVESMPKVTPLDGSQVATAPLTRSAMVKAAKDLARAERLGAGQTYSQVTLATIGNLGVGIRLYFMLTKYCAGVFLLMSLCAAPAAVLHYYGHGVTSTTKDPLNLNYVSLANEGISQEYVPTNCTYNGGTMDCSLRTIDTPITTNPKIAAYIATGCDCAYSLVFVVFTIVFAARCHDIVAQHGRENITPAKYSVYVRGFPRDATEDEICAHFSTRYDPTTPEEHYPLWLGCFGRRRAAKKRLDKTASVDPPAPLAPVENLDHVDGNSLYLNSWVAQVSVAHPVGGFLRLFLAMENITQEIGRLEASLVEYRKQPVRFKTKLPKVEARLALLQAKLTKKTDRMKAFKTHGDQRLRECECAFVVFNHVESQRRCLNDYRTSASSWKRAWQPRGLRFRGTFPLKVIQAPEPSNIIWENLETTPTARFLRRSLTNFITFILLIVSCAIISLAQGAQKKFNTPGPDNLCDKILDVYQGPNFTSSNDTAWSLAWNASQTCPQSKSYAIAYVNHSAAPFASSILPWNAADEHANLTRCISPCYDTNATCGTLPCFSTDRNRTSDDDPCEAYPPESILVCYCKPKLEWYIQTQGVYHGPTALWTTELPCRDYITAFVTKNALLVAAACTVIFVNTALRSIFYAFATLERHSSESNKAAAVVVKLFFAQWINTAVIVLVVNAQLGNTAMFSSLLSGTLTDMQRAWYTSVGAGITLTMIINVVTPHIGPLLSTYVLLPLTRFVSMWSTVTQPDMTALFANPDFDISVRYPVVLNTLFVTFMYAGGIPALLPIGAVSCGLNYAIDKLMLMRLYRVRTAYDESLGALALQLFPYMLLLHLGFSAWAYGVTNVLQSDVLSVSTLAKGVSSALASVGQAANVTDALPVEDPTEQAQAFIQAKIEVIRDPFLASLMQGVLKAYVKIIRINTFPVFFLFVCVLLWMLLHRLLDPIFHYTLGLLLRGAGGACGGLARAVCRCCCRRRHRGGIYPSGELIFPGFTSERPIEDKGLMERPRRTWEAMAAHVKTYAIETNPKYAVS